MSEQPESTRLSRRLSTSDAVHIGLGSMIGAGIFAAAGPAAAAAGSGLLFGVVIAGCVAFLNATTMAQLAAIYPESGGTYAYGRKRLSPLFGFLAGWGFVIGKIASCTAMALTFAFYASPDHARPLAVSTVLILTFINYLGVRKTAFATRIIVSLVIASLGIVVLAALAGGASDLARFGSWTDRGGISGILQAAGMMFFAFAGYARIATLGEEVVNPRKTIPRAIVISLFVTLVIYLVVIGATVLSVDILALANAKAPLVLAVESGRYAFLSPIVRFGACIASVGVLLSLLAGVSRTVFAMAANRDLPHFLSAVHPTHKVPHRAELLIGIIVASIVAMADIRLAIGFSSFAILVYYAIANAASWTLGPEERLWPRWMSGLGILSCLLVASNLPRQSLIGGVVLFAIGTVLYWVFHRVRGDG